jgi:hypothetical protein
MKSKVARVQRARVLRLFGLLMLVSMLAPRSAHAYVDPSTGSILLQVLIAGALGAAFTVRQWWARLATAARRLRGRVRRP